ncbi:MAG: ABC transporter permease [Candidatus Sulfotelmatobacter sp.]
MATRLLPVKVGARSKGDTLQSLLQDLRYAIRQLRKSPGFTSVALFTLALGIGANTSIFSAVNAVLLRPLPYRDPNRLVYIWSAEKARGINQSTVSIPDFRDWQQQNHVFAGMTALFASTFNFSGANEPLQVNGWTVATNFFDVLGARPQLGRTFVPDEEQWGKHRVAILSHTLWMSSFGGNASVLGKEVTVDAEPFTIIGVMPAEFSSPHSEVQLWVPMSPPPGMTINRDQRFMRVIARLKPGVTAQRAQVEMETLTHRLEQEYPEDRGATAYLVPAEQQIVGAIRPALLVLLGAVSFVLLLACTNLASLLLARSAGRAKEFAVRMALGASRGRLIGQLVTESLLLALLGGALGVLLAGWGTALLRMLAAKDVPRAQDIHIDVGVLAFALALSLLTGLAFGLIPAFESSKGHVNEPLKEGGRGVGQGMRARRVRDLLVVSETALALVLLVGAGLLINTFHHLRSVNGGFNPERVLTAEVSLPSSKYRENQQSVSFFQQLLERVRKLPGVKFAGATLTLPLGGGGRYWMGLEIEGRPAAQTREDVPIVAFFQVTPGYFQAMGIPLRKGRLFDDRDNQSSSLKVAIVSETLARRFFSGTDPIGKQIRVDSVPLTVVGVSGDAIIDSLTDPSFPEVYTVHSQRVTGASGNMVLALRTDADPLSLAAALREQVHGLDKQQSVANIQTLQQVVSESLTQPRLNTLLLGAFALLALLLTATGTYSVLSYSVTQRTQEIGIRMALGADRRDVLRLMVGRGLFLTLMGMITGLAAAFGLTRLMAGLLFGVRPTDAATFVVVSLVITGVALLASYLPARRAIKIDPMVALHYE